jgi:two-component system chemotaxis response regulator CheY
VRVRILIVEDSQIMRNIHKRVLSEHKVAAESIVEASNGSDALNLAVKLDIDLFLVDWNIPGLNGLEFVKAVRAMEKYAKSPIVMITSEAAKYHVLAAVEAGVTDYVIKPIQGHVLWKKLAPYLGEAKA